MSSRLPSNLGGFHLLSSYMQDTATTRYRAEAVRNGKPTDIAVLSEQWNTPVMSERLRRRAKEFTSVSHPEILHILTVGRTKECLFIASEPAPYQTLGEYIAATGPLPLDAVSMILHGLAEILSKLHASGLAYGYLTADQVYLTAHGEPQLSALDLVILPLTANDGTMSPCTAPEVRRGQPSAVAADVYALACILYESLRGYRLIAPLSIAAIMADSTLPIPIRVVLGRALELSPRARYASIEVAADAIQASLDSATTDCSDSAKPTLTPFSLEELGLSAAGGRFSGLTPLSQSARFERPASLSSPGDGDLEPQTKSDVKPNSISEAVDLELTALGLAEGSEFNFDAAAETAEPELTPFSLEDLGLSPDEIALLSAAEEPAASAAPAAAPDDDIPQWLREYASEHSQHHITDTADIPAWLSGATSEQSQHEGEDFSSDVFEDVPDWLRAAWVERYEARRFEGAMPQSCELGNDTAAHCMVPLASSEGLRRYLPATSKSPDQIKQGDERGHDIQVPVRQEWIVLYLKVESRDFTSDPQAQSIMMRAGADSGVATFSLTPIHSRHNGQVRIQLFTDQTYKLSLDTLTLICEIRPRPILKAFAAIVAQRWRSTQPPIPASSSSEPSPVVNHWTIVHGSLLNFGTGNQLGDVSIGDIAGGSITKVNIQRT